MEDDPQVPIHGWCVRLNQKLAPTLGKICSNMSTYIVERISPTTKEKRLERANLDAKTPAGFRAWIFLRPRGHLHFAQSKGAGTRHK